MHGLGLVILIYLVTRFRARLRFFPPWQQALSVLALLVNDRIIALWILSLKGDELPSAGFWLAPILGTLLWPWIFLLLDRYRSLARHRGVS
jgi:rod shape-determining protein MreD